MSETDPRLTRRERDAAVALLVSILVPVAAGFLTGLQGYAETTAYEYRAIALLLLLGAGAYLVYRGIRRTVGIARARSAGG